MPIIAAATTFATQIWSHAASAEHHGALQFVLILFGLGHWTKPQRFVRHRPDKLTVTVPATFADVEDLFRDVGFQPRIPVEEGVRRFVAWYKEFYRN